MAESIPENGKIAIIGIGPGAIEHMTFKARQAIEDSDIIVGYKTYISLIKDLVNGKEIIQSAMLKEVERANIAIDFAVQGKKVGVISSGDAGVYGMAGLIFEVYKNRGLSGANRIEVIPGVSALNAAASLLGAPLMHDFAAISLSDLLTPWSVIQQRISLAAQSDFVIVLYNPQSHKRTSQLREARELILKHRATSTPVGVVTAAYRDQETVELTDLEHLLDVEVGMLTTVVIGNSSTFICEGQMVTPRGYDRKYDLLSDK